MRLSEAAEPVFARHETFHPRYGWFRKAYATAANSERGFTAEDAPVAMGVGKNMVRSIKFWGLAAKVIAPDPGSANKRAPDMIPTGFGHGLFADDGWDPFMEDPGTVWLLHWMLLAPPTQVPVWWLAFNELHAVDFDDDTLGAAVRAQLEANGSWAAPSDSAIDKDTSIFIRTYAPAVRSGRTAFDDILDCPFRELGLVTRSAATGNHRFVLGAKPTLPDDIVAFAVLDYLSRRPSSAQTITLAHLANEPGGPGRAFKLREGDLYLALKNTGNMVDGLELLAPTGAQQLAWTRPSTDLAIETLNRYYERDPENVRVGLAGDEPVDRELLPDRSHVMVELFTASERHPMGAPS